jgi:hypothetical protein
MGMIFIDYCQDSTEAICAFGIAPNGFDCGTGYPACNGLIVSLDFIKLSEVFIGFDKLANLVPDDVCLILFCGCAEYAAVLVAAECGEVICKSSG